MGPTYTKTVYLGRVLTRRNLSLKIEKTMSLALIPMYVKKESISIRKISLTDSCFLKCGFDVLMVMHTFRDSSDI